MRISSFIVGIVFILVSLCGSFLEAFEIQYPGEDGFYIGKPMVYTITVDPNDDQNVDQEGIFTFGKDRITIDGKDYYDCVFHSPSGYSHFYLGIDQTNSNLLQKGFKLGSSELIVDPAITAVRYPLNPGDSWSEKTDLTAENLEIPGLGQINIPISIKGLNVETKAFSEIISVPAGTFDTILVEANFSGSMLGIPMILIQRTWLNKDNVPVKRNFEFLKPTNLLLYEIELSSLSSTPWDLNWDGVVNILDVVIVARYFGKQITEPTIPNPDVDGNGSVDILDLAKVGIHFGESYNSAAPAAASQNVNYSIYSEILNGVYQEVIQQIPQISGDDRVGLSKILRAVDMVLAERPPRLATCNALFQSFPNPCNPEVWLPYALGANSPVLIRIHNASGKLIRELKLGYKTAGVYTSKVKAAHWDGKNSAGEKVVSGVYFYTIQANEFTATGRMLVSK